MNRRKFFRQGAAGATLGMLPDRATMGSALASQRVSSPGGLGINLTGLVDWNREHPFVDPFRLSRRWISQAEGKPFGQGPPLDLDDRGWIRKLEPSCWAETLLYTNQKDHIPEGRYRIVFEGRGQISSGLNARFAGQSGHMAAFDVEHRGEGISLAIRATDPNDPIRNLRIIPPGVRELDPAKPFRPEFLNLWRGMGLIRFMDWMATNDSDQVTWNDRPRLEDANWTTRGAPIEIITKLADTLRSDPWICIPHQADNDYVRNLAESVLRNLDADLRVWVELSNETWNGIFRQASHFREMGRNGKFGAGNEYQGQLEAYSARSLQVFRIFDKVFGTARHRVVRVLSAQSVNPWTSEVVLKTQDAFRHCDILAIAPYFGNEFGDPKNAESIENLPLDRLMPMVARAASESRRSMESSLAVAKKFGVALAAYEAGQHLVGHSGAENRQKLTDLFHAANRHPAMQSIYADYLKDWVEVGGGPMCLFSSVTEYTKWGSWGLLEWPDDPPQKAPKFAAVRQFDADRPRWWNVGRTSEKS